MDQLINVLQATVNVIMILIVCKSILGYHFPWETCNCCNKKWRDHK